jgi:hypothetical protein
MDAVTVTRDLQASDRDVDRVSAGGRGRPSRPASDGVPCFIFGGVLAGPTGAQTRLIWPRRWRVR